MCVCGEGGEEGEEDGRRKAERIQNLKTKTPHVNVGNKKRI